MEVVGPIMQAKLEASWNSVQAATATEPLNFGSSVSNRFSRRLTFSGVEL